MKVLIVIDMQKDFTTGSLANPAAEAIINPVAGYVRRFNGDAIIATRDTHHADYLDTYEGQNLPVEHCIYDTEGWKIEDEIYDTLLLKRPFYLDIINKPTFGFAEEIANSIKEAQKKVKEEKGNTAARVDTIEFVGTVTEICVISNVLGLKPLFPNADFIVHKDLCAGLSEEGHNAALTVMKACQVKVI